MTLVEDTAKFLEAVAYGDGALFVADSVRAQAGNLVLRWQERGAIDQDRPGGVHAYDPPASRRARSRSLPRTGTIRRRVYDLLKANPAGLTAPEVAQLLGVPSNAAGNSAAKRLSELVQDGWALREPWMRNGAHIHTSL